MSEAAETGKRKRAAGAAVPGHDRPLACCWRDHRSGVHANRFLRARALRVTFFMEAATREGRACVSDFASVKPLASWLADTFGGTVLAAADDPDLAYFRMLDRINMARLVEVEETGLEPFAALVLDAARDWIADTYGEQGDFRLLAVEVAEWEEPAESSVVREAA